MIIPIELAPSASGSKLPSGLAKISNNEVAVIELQGVLEVESTSPNERDGKIVGRLQIDETTSKPTLMIGHHLLEGKIATLAKPLAILRRSPNPDSATSNGSTHPNADAQEGADAGDAMDCDLDRPRRGSGMNTMRGGVGTGIGRGEETGAGGGGRGTGGGEGSKWEIVAVVKKKILFAKRPMPIVNMPLRN